MRILFALGMGAVITGCSMIPQSWLNGSAESTSTGGSIQLYPSSTSVVEGQSVTFQASGGTPPYLYQVQGDGTVDTNGNFQAGAMLGSAQVQVTDANGNTGLAYVSVIQTGTTSPSWTPTTAAQLKQSPPVRGQVVGVEDATQRGGEQVHRKFIKTDLKHPLVRLDEQMAGKQVVATRAIVEDQFVVSLLPGFSEEDLRSALAQGGGHISKTLTPAGTYLVSMDRKSSSISAAFFAARESLKEHLKTVAKVTPEAILSPPRAASF